MGKYITQKLSSHIDTSITFIAIASCILDSNIGEMSLYPSCMHLFINLQPANKKKHCSERVKYNGISILIYACTMEILWNI